MKNTLFSWRGVRLCALGCALLLVLTTAAYAKTFSGTPPKFDEAKLGRQVMFPGIDEVVWVLSMGLYTSDDPKYAEYRLPDETVDKLIRARDRNAFWLLCEDRRDYSSIAYTYVFANNSGLNTRVNAVEGRYDRGVYFKVPSEYLLYQCDLAKCQFKSENGYFKVIEAPVPKPEEQPYNRSVLPSYIKWASPIRVAWGHGWEDPRALMALDEFRMKEDFINGAELWFDQDDLKLVKEIITEPTALEDGPGWDYDKAAPVTEVEYEYADYYGNGRDFPCRVTVRNNGVKELELEFRMADGFWMLDQGKLYSGSPDDEYYHAQGFNTASIVVKR